MELLVADQPARKTLHDPIFPFWTWADRTEVTQSRFPAAQRWAADPSHNAMRVNLDACIQCNLCLRGCREVQGNAVIRMAYRNAASKVVFDFDDPVGASTCVACGECVQVCPTGALMPAACLNDAETRTVWPDRKVDGLCPYRGVGCQVSYEVKDDRIVYAQGRTARPTTTGSASRAASASTTSTPRTGSPGRWSACPTRPGPGGPGQSLDPFPRGDLGRGAGPSGRRPQPH